MKRKVTITGPKVHDVGFRPWLAEMAMKLSLKGFEVKNAQGDMQAVVALVEGDEGSVMHFCDLASRQWPPLADVESVGWEDYEADLMPIWQAATINTSEQINKAIPLLIGAVDSLERICDLLGRTSSKMDKVIEKQGGATEQIQVLREEMMDRGDARMARIETDIRQIKLKMGLR